MVFHFPFQTSDVHDARVPIESCNTTELGSVALHESSDKIKERGEVSTDFLLKLANQSWN